MELGNLNKQTNKGSDKNSACLLNNDQVSKLEPLNI